MTSMDAETAFLESQDLYHHMLKKKSTAEGLCACCLRALVFDAVSCNPEFCFKAPSEMRI